MEQAADQEQDTDIEKVNIDSVTFNSNHSVIKANLKTSTKNAVITVPYKVDMGSDGNIRSLYI